EPSRWAILALLGIAQLMVVLDATIVNIALPSAQKALGFSTDSRQWIVTAYALAFGSLLLLGGKLGDLFGRKWTFIAGLIGFGAVSALGGLDRESTRLDSTPFPYTTLFRSRLRQPAAARRQARRPVRPQVDVHRRPDRLRRRLGARRTRSGEHTSGLHPLPLHDALPISPSAACCCSAASSATCSAASGRSSQA